MSSVIRTRDLSKRFRRSLVLDGLNLEVPEGSIYGLVGPNGAGKTTTIKVLMNIMAPTSGHSEVLGADSRHLRPRHFAQIGYVSENQEIPEWMTVNYYLEFLSNFYPTWDRGLAAELVRQLQLPGDRKLRHLSHGMRMKAALASSLAYRPRLMVLDEPFTGLDALVRDELIEGVLAHAEGATIFISSHDLTEIESFASHIGYLEQGRLQFSEELESLSARFREIVLTFSNAPPVPAPWPANWLQPQVSGAVIRLVETQFHPQRTSAEVRRVFPEFLDMTANAMPLRSIFVTLAKAARKAV
jgi:ABC-2 type transport system ATP-binding protein